MNTQPKQVSSHSVRQPWLTRQNSLWVGAGLMVLGAAIFLGYAVVFLFLALASSGFELGVETLNGVTRQQLDGINPAIMGYITHLHVAIAGFIGATAIAAWGPVRGSQGLVVGMDNCCNRTLRGFGRGVAYALHGTTTTG